jgi:formyl-CoA transferase/succinyl-CoA--D-citramalate CoA-transferase
VSTAATGPPSLTGLRVLELGSFVAGPFAGQLLGDHGAEVIKVEAPGAGDPMRQWGLCRDGRSLWWPAIARNKRSVAVDLRTADGRQVVHRLADRCDVVLENFTPGRLAEWGMSYRELARTNPGLILTHVSGFGQTGPLSPRPGFGSVGEAMGGIRHLTGWPDRPSTRAGIALGDAFAALFAVAGTLTAVLERERSGLGQEVDVALYESVFAMMEGMVAEFELEGHVRGRTGSVLPGVAPSNVYEAADGRSVLIAANGDALFARLCQVMGRPDLASDERYATHAARAAHQAELDAHIAAYTATVPAADLMAALEAAAVPHSLIYTAADIASDPHYEARQMIRRVYDAGLDTVVPMPGVVPKLTRTPGSIRTVGPELGEHTHWALTAVAGYDEHDVQALVDRGVVAVAG